MGFAVTSLPGSLFGWFFLVTSLDHHWSSSLSQGYQLLNFLHCLPPASPVISFLSLFGHILGPIEVPGLGVKWELQLLASTTVTATPEP